MANSRLKFVLVIIDGLGLSDSNNANALKLARTPVIDKLFDTCPWSTLEASQGAVGLPEGVIGNSEVGHMTIGAGRIIKHDLVRINEAIRDGKLGHIPELRDVITYVREKENAIHLMGLLSDGGVHSHIDHLFALLRIFRDAGLKQVFLHAITDGRDTSPFGGFDYVGQTIQQMDEIGIGSFATITGRYYTMDRDKRWDRIEIAYKASVIGEGEQFSDPLAAVKFSYDQDVTDEFIKPKIILNEDERFHTIKEHDALFCFNFRADRMRQIACALGTATFTEFHQEIPPIFTTTMTCYNDSFTFPILFKFVKLNSIFGEILWENNFRQLRVAESEKYAHVTYFFNGGDETPFPQEDRILIPSPKVPTYDLQPEMSARGVEGEVLRAIQSDEYDCIIMNIANPDMVGHTGNLEATIKAAEVSDSVVGHVVDAVTEKGAMAFVTSDHGNLEIMIEPETGEIYTAHTLSPVPLILVNTNNQLKLKNTGGLADIAPTILDFLSIPKPDEMTGQSLLIKE